MISLAKALKIIHEPSSNGITFKEWSELPLGEEALKIYILGSNGFATKKECTIFLAEEFQKYKNYSEIK
jgi:hypothetical protein